eukprot:TRINITY_DN12373_c0_g1_i1.p1 TRINITY_DN12373_c0_g1~~TRINITY_DN12373_c0_g1_i1.p1  ORF type:complete len:528 (-),score=141.11 TRINITY_DN12373_c0_g1_i1:111-1694(-)
MSTIKRTERGEKRGIKRSRTTERRLKMYNDRPERNKRGKVTFHRYQSKDTSHQARVQPDRRWFGPTRTSTTGEISAFREEMGRNQDAPNTVLLRGSKIPYSLLKDPKAKIGGNLLQVETFEDTFGDRSRRKRPKLRANTLEGMMQDIEDRSTEYTEETDSNIIVPQDFKYSPRHPLFSKGQSNRIWNELFKVVDSSDVIVQVLDARNPMGTRCHRIEKHIKDNCPHKSIILVLNKCDLIPNWATKKWKYLFSKEYPTLAFHASLTKSFGKGALISLLRQFQHMHSDKQQISVGFIGYPNVGKSSIINTLRSKKVCKVAPVPGETKVWQYITLFRRVFLIDCPGVVYPDPDDKECDIVLKGVVRIEGLQNPVEFIPPVLERTKREYIERTYRLTEWETPLEFLEAFARRTGKLLKKGEPDIQTCAKMVLNDWLRGKIPYFYPPPEDPTYEPDTVVEEKTEKGKVHLPRQIISGLRVKDGFDDEASEEEKGEVDEEESEEVEILNETGNDTNEPLGDVEEVKWEDVFPN